MRRKLANVIRDERVALSMPAGGHTRLGLEQVLVVHGAGRVTEGGAAELLRRLAQTYIGLGATFPPGQDHPPGYVLRITPHRLGGVGPWTAATPLQRLGLPPLDKPETGLP
jgi:hypothetical protein